MLNKALRVGQLIANAHPNDVRLLFADYGITAQPTGKTIMDAYLVHGKPFLYDLFDIGYQSKFSGFGETTGLEVDKLNDRANSAYEKAAAEAAAEKQTTLDGILSIFGKAENVLTKVKGAYDSVLSIFGKGSAVDTGGVDANTALNNEMMQAKLDAIAAQEANKTKTYLLIGAGVLLAVLAVIMYMKSRK